MEQSSSFLIGHHDSKRNVPISSDLAQQAHSAGVGWSFFFNNRTDRYQYDMLTFPITTPHFHSKVLSVLSSAFSKDADSHEGLHSTNAVPVSIDPLTPADTQLTPDESISSIIGITSAWIDLGSPDPIIADTSRQVLKLELAYAAFCGVSYVIVHGPRQNDSCDVAAYARAILDGLSQGPYMQLFLWTNTHPDPVCVKEQVGDLTAFARREYALSNDSGENTGAYGPWHAWDNVRSICKYSTRLCLGETLAIGTIPLTDEFSFVSLDISSSTCTAVSMVFRTCPDLDSRW